MGHSSVSATAHNRDRAGSRAVLRFQALSIVLLDVDLGPQFWVFWCLVACLLDLGQRFWVLFFVLSFDLFLQCLKSQNLTSVVLPVVTVHTRSQFSSSLYDKNGSDLVMAERRHCHHQIRSAKVI
jgi:hypothetical protein